MDNLEHIGYGNCIHGNNLANCKECKPPIIPKLIVPTEDPNKCAYGWHDGACCCNCANRIQVNKHPSNTIAKGSISEKFSYLCMNVFEDQSGTATIMEWEHWFCEGYRKKQDKKK